MWGLSRHCESMLWQGGLQKEALVENEMSRVQPKTHALMRVNLLVLLFIIIYLESLHSTFNELQRETASSTERIWKRSLCYVKDL